MTQLLQSTVDPETVLELTVMILFQQVKQVVACGSLLRGPILLLLLEERKISEPVGSCLRDMAVKLEDEGPDNIGEALVLSVKEIGLCRDISKYQMENS